jgi:short-subunit dehydrogenase
MVHEWCKKRRLVVRMLVNNAGVGYQGKFEHLDTCFCENLLQLNVIALTLLTREFLPDLASHESAYILNVSSLSSFYPMPFKSVYAASKAYVTAFSYALSEELKNTSVTVTTVCPAGVDSSSDSTDKIDKIGWIARIGRLTPDQVADAAISGMLKRKRRIVPGIINNLLYYATRSLPSKLKAWLVYHTLRRFQKIHMHHKVETISTSKPK